jgi:hypothetical protein
MCTCPFPNSFPIALPQFFSHLTEANTTR